MATSEKQTTEEIRHMVQNAAERASKVRASQGYGWKRYIDVFAITFATLTAVNALKKRREHETEMEEANLREERLKERLRDEEEKVVVARRRLTKNAPELIKGVMLEARAWKGGEEKCKSLIERWIEQGFEQDSGADGQNVDSTKIADDRDGENDDGKRHERLKFIG